MSLYPITVGVGDNFNDEPVPTDSIALDTADNDDSSVDSTECVPLNFQWVWETDKCVRFISSDGKKVGSASFVTLPGQIKITPRPEII
jgi:hypothetical protein